MDDVDRAILAELEENGRLSNQDLALRVGLTAAPCLRRVKKLEESGVIRGYSAKINQEALGRGFEVIAQINIVNTDKCTVEAFERRLQEMEEIVEVRRMFGTPDYVLLVRVADVTAYEQWLTGKVYGDPAIARIDSRMTMKVLKSAL